MYIRWYIPDREPLRFFFLTEEVDVELFSNEAVLSISLASSDLNITTFSAIEGGTTPKI